MSSRLQQCECRASSLRVQGFVEWKFRASSMRDPGLNNASLGLHQWDVGASSMQVQVLSIASSGLERCEFRASLK